MERASWRVLWVAVFFATTACWPSSSAPTRTGNSPSPSVSAGTPEAQPWSPALGGRWQYQLQASRKYAATGGIDVDICAVPLSGGSCVRPEVFDIDLYDLDGVTPNTKAVNAIHMRGAHAVCYVDAGSIETYRPDYKAFVRFDTGCNGCLIGHPFSKIFNDENWANINNDHGQRDFVLRMNEARVQKCGAAGFDGVEFDVVDAYASGKSVTGWTITAGTQLTFNRALAEIAHRHGLAVGLKNDLGQIPALLPSFDFAVNEQCFQYSECHNLRLFVQAGKPVFQVEYRLSRSKFCGAAERERFSSIVKARDFSLYAKPYLPCQ